LVAFPGKNRPAHSLASKRLFGRVSSGIACINFCGRGRGIHGPLSPHFLNLELLGSGSFGALLFQKFHLLALRLGLRFGLLGGLLLGSPLCGGLLLCSGLHIGLLFLRGLLFLLARAFASASSEPS
jgi:hypothetical protein